MIGFGRNSSAVVGALQLGDVGWQVSKGKVVHAFVKASMCGNFDTVGFWIEPEDVSSGLGEETEKNAFPGIWSEFSPTTAGGTDPDATTKRAEGSEIVSFVEGKLQRRNKLIARGQRIVDTQPVMEGVGPKTDGDVTTSKDGAYCVGNRKMATLDGTVLMGGIGACGENFIAELGKERENTRIGVEFAALVHVDVFGGAGWSVFLEE